MQLRALTCLVALLPHFVLSAPNPQLYELEFEELMEKQYVSIASGQLTPIQKAAAVATVITAKDIEALGATDLDEVLETVPGLHVSNTFSNYNPIYSFRGIQTLSNPETLFLLNGSPITSLYRGDRGGIWGGMPVKSIARIEIIRGPGSAVYGADAFSGVVNIITKTAEDIPENVFGVGYGSFNTRDSWLLTSSRVLGAEVVFTAELRDTDGPRETVYRDAQALRDTMDATRASHAPGPTQLSRRAADFHLDIHKDQWRFHGAYQGRHNVGHGAGFAEALDPYGRYESTRYNLNLQHSNPKIADNWELTTTLSLHHIDQQAETNTYLQPPGSVLTISPFRIPLPNGLIGNPEVWENNKRIDVAAFYQGYDSHRIRIGAGYYKGDIYKIRETKNFDLTFVPQPSVVDYSNTDQAFLAPGGRENLFLSLQDEWSMSSVWTLTSGVRYDHYSDFGETINPRIALIWETSDTVTTKFLYGKAFRAPSFSELFSVNPVGFGNPDLKPETINTYEIAVSVRPTTRFHYDATLFQYAAKDFIVYEFAGSSYNARNHGEQTGNGAELEARYQVMPELLLAGNYSFLHVHHSHSLQDSGKAPRHQLFVKAEWTFQPEWSLVPQLIYIGKRERSNEDPRPAVDDYALVNLTLHRRNLFNKLDASLAIRNLLDADVREPASQNLPDDLPKAGLSVFGSVAYRF